MQYAIDISERQSRRVLEQAVRMQSQLLIEPVGIPERTILGFIASGDSDVLIAELTGPPHPWLRELVGRNAGVQLFQEERYLFNSKILGGPTWHEGEQITLQCPRVLQVMQRRRFWRARLAPSSLVSLRWTHGGRPLQTNGPLLNVSSEGLACKLDGGAAQSISVGGRVQVEFRIPQSAGAFHFDAVVRNCSPTSDETWILGMEFRVEGDEEQLAAQQRLRDLLYQSHAAECEAASR
jgi:hypothetical protein